MMLLPKDVGPFTLVRKLGTGAVAESYLGRLKGDEQRDVVVRRILPYILQDAGRLASTEARVRDLVGVRHPFLVQVLDWVEDGDERFIVEDLVSGVDLERVLAWCKANDQTIPHNVFLNLATQVCNGLEALHGRPGRGSGADNVLHLGLRPGAIHATADGKVVLGGFGLTRSPTTLSHGGVSSPVPTRMEYLSPEQTSPDQKLTPASDIFSLGAVLYELLTLQPLFRSDSNLQTINRIRKAEVTTQLLQVKDAMPGLDKVLYRALSLNPRHRYQRAFVLREDLRGLMAGYSFSTIVDDTRAFFAPMLNEATATMPQSPRVDSAPPEVPVAGVAAAGVAAAGVAAAGVAAATPKASKTAIPELPPDEPTAEELIDAGIGSGTPNLSQPSTTGAFALGTGVASRVAATLSGPSPVDVARPPATLPPAIPLPLETGFEDEIATKVGRLPGPSSTAALAADAVREHLATEDAPVDEVPAVGPDGTSEELAERATLPIPPSGTDEDDRTDARVGGALLAGAAGVAAVGAAAAADPNSTRAFLRGEGDGKAGAPPPAAPDPASSGIGSRNPVAPGPAAPPPPMVAMTPPPTAAARPVAPSLPPAAAAPAVPASPSAAAQGSDRLAALAPPPTARSAAVAPAPPSTSPPATPPSAATDDWTPPPKRGNGVMLGVAAGIVVLMLACAVGSYFVTQGRTGGDEPVADAEPPRTGSIDDALAAAAGEDPPGNTPSAKPPPGTDQPAPAATTAAATTAAPATGAPTTGAPTTAAPTPASRPASGSSSAPIAAARPASSSGSSSSGRTSASSGSSSASTGRTSASPAASSGSASWSSGRPSSTAVDDAVADIGDPAEDTGAPQATDVERYASPASQGKLTSSDIMTLETVQIEDNSYTRSRALLLMHAQRTKDEAAAKRYLDQLMQLPENQYNPIYLSDLGRYYVNRKQYSQALDKARLAERYWARLPPELVFSKKAEIYETQASAWQGSFYASGDYFEQLDQAIRHWEKYRDHVETKSRTDLAGKAEGELAKLADIKRRLQ